MQRKEGLDRQQWWSPPLKICNSVRSYVRSYIIYNVYYTSYNATQGGQTIVQWWLSASEKLHLYKSPLVTPPPVYYCYEITPMRQVTRHRGVVQQKRRTSAPDGGVATPEKMHLYKSPMITPPPAIGFTPGRTQLSRLVTMRRVQVQVL